MKRFRNWLVGLLVVCGLMMVGCHEEPPESPLSSATDISITEVCGEDVVSGAVTLTTAQYNELMEASDKGAKVTYTLAEGANVVVTLNDKTLNFAITAEDGTTASASLSIAVLSNATALNITKVCNVDVVSGEVTLTTAQYNELMEASDKGAKVTYTLAEGANVVVTLEDKTLNFAITAEDGTTASASVSIAVLSNATALNVTKVCNVDVVSGAVTLTTAQYNELVEASDKGAKVTYTLAEGANVVVTLDDKTLNFAITAEDGTTASASVSITVLSNATALNITKVCNVDVVSGVVTLTTAQYNELMEASDKGAKVTYTLAEGANVVVTLDDKTLNFAITAEDGTTASASVSIAVLSNDTTLTVRSLFGIEEKDGVFTVSAQQWETLITELDLTSYLVVEKHENAEIVPSFAEESGVLSIAVTAEDGTLETYEKTVEVEELFVPYQDGTMGNDLGYQWDKEKKAYVTRANTNGFSAYRVGDGTLSNDFAFFAEITLQELVKEGEIVLNAQVRSNRTIRFAVRATSTTQIRVFTDYRDDSGFLNDMTVVAAHDYTGAFSMGIIAYGDHVAMIWNGETVYHRALEGISQAEFMMNGAYNMICELRNIQVEDDSAKVDLLYAQAMEGYQDPLIGQTLVRNASSQLDLISADLTERSVTAPLRFVGPDDGTKRIRTAIYKDGNPFGGYAWAVSGTFYTQVKFNFIGGIRFWAYQDSSNCLGFTVNRRVNSSGTNNSIYTEGWEAGVKAVANGIVGTADGLGKGETDADNVNTYQANFILIYDHGYIGFVIENKLWYTYQLEFAYAGFIVDFISPTAAKLWNLQFFTEKDEVESLRATWDPSSESEDILVENDVFQKTARSVVKKTAEYASIALKDENGRAWNGEAFVLQTTVWNDNPSVWGQAEIKITEETGQGVRFALEYLANGTYQIFAEKFSGSSNWLWTLIEGNTIKMQRIAISYLDGKLYLSLADAIYYACDLSGAVMISFGGKGCDCRFEDVSLTEDVEEVQTFVDGLSDYGYASAYRGRAKSFVDTYGGRTGEIVIAGTSTFDFWRSTRKDSNGNYVTGYLSDLAGLPDANEDGEPDVLNFGIGATRWDDWLSFYKSLIKDFAPSALVITCGANDFASGETVDGVYAEFELFMQYLRADFATLPVYFLHSSPSPNLYSDYWTQLEEYKSRVDAFAEEDGYMTTIDLFDQLADENGPLTQYWDADGSHLNREGYAILGAAIKEALLS